MAGVFLFIWSWGANGHGTLVGENVIEMSAMAGQARYYEPDFQGFGDTVCGWALTLRDGLVRTRTQLRERVSGIWLHSERLWGSAPLTKGEAKC